MTSPHNTCPCWDSCSKWGGRGASFEALSKRDDILGSELKALAIISHEWRLTETISSYSNFVLPWFNSAFWSSDCFIMYSSKSSRPKLPISRSWTSLRSESFSREVSISREEAISREVSSNRKRVFWGKNRLQKTHRFLPSQSSHIQTYSETTHEIREGPHARWICALTLGLRAMSRTNLQSELESNLWLSHFGLYRNYYLKNLWKLFNWQITIPQIDKHSQA